MAAMGFECLYLHYLVRPSMNSTPAAGSLRTWPVLVIDDEKTEGVWIVERLLEHGQEIECIADCPDAVKYEPNTLTLRVQLVSALAAITNCDGDKFRSVCQHLPTVVVLDQFLPDPDQPGDTTTRASLRICELVNEIWDRVLQQPEFRPLGWNLCVLMYTGQNYRFMERWLEQASITGRTWFDYATKPDGIPVCTKEVASAEGRQLTQQINALTSGTRPRGARLEVVPDLYAAGRQGALLREAIRTAKSSPKPVWIVGRWRDGCEKVVPLVLAANAHLEPASVGNDALFERLHQLRRGLTVHPVFVLVGQVSVERLASFCQRVDRKFVVICDEPPDPKLATCFSTINLLPLFQWEVGDIQELFQANWGRKVSHGVVSWLQERLFDYTNFCELYFMEGESIDASLLSERCRGLRSETLAIEVRSPFTSASIRWRGSLKTISLSTYGGISAVAVLRAMIGNAKNQFDMRTLVDGMLPFDQARKIREWSEKITDPTKTGHTFRRNAFSSSSSSNAQDLLHAVIGRQCIKGGEYEVLEKCLVRWTSIPRPNVTKGQ